MVSGEGGGRVPTAAIKGSVGDRNPFETVRARCEAAHLGPGQPSAGLEHPQVGTAISIMPSTIRSG